MVFWRGYFVIILVLFSATFAVAKQCDRGWREFKNNCYLFSKAKQSWTNSRATCEKMGGHLAKILSAAQQDFIVQQIILEGTQHNWIGGSEIGRIGEWAWESTGEKILFSKWYPGEPNNKKENCLLLHAGYKYNWSDISCAEKHSFVCEKAGNLVHQGCSPAHHCCNYKCCNQIQC